MWLVGSIVGGFALLLKLDAPYWSVLVPIVIGVVGVRWVIGPWVRNPRCPSCSQRMVVSNARAVRDWRRGGVNLLADAYTCRRCGFTFHFIAG